MSKKEITFKRITYLPDKDRHVILDGKVIGNVYWGWERLGGHQWLSTKLPFNARGKTLKEIKQAIEYKLNKSVTDEG